MNYIDLDYTYLPRINKSNLAEYRFLPWNNLYQLSNLWTILTKYKNNLTEGFRLENISWRLWYRQFILKKKNKPNITDDIHTLVQKQDLLIVANKTHSMPAHNKSPISHRTIATVQPKQRKFYFHYGQEHSIMKKKNTISNTLSKPVSLLSQMLKYDDTLSNSSSLRRCQSRYYCRLDQFFLNSA
ncbi:MAG: hypothetical protein EXX96DRAFT_583598 [Benjaminiella poitrasii]|nr:MAG: hypothetical protein EXX96DRAFT_583598 [Benjaminiella poitrasii]